MAFGDLPMDAPCKPNKGNEGGACNRQSCQAEPALFYNHGSRAWYCADCKRDIGEDSFNKQNWDINWRPRLGHAMFETRDEINAREARAKTIDGQIEQLTAPYFGWPRHRIKNHSPSLQRILKQAKRR